MRLAGDLIDESGTRGEEILGDTLLLLMNAHHEPLPFVLPVLSPGHDWELLFDTSTTEIDQELKDEGHKYPLKERSMALFRTTSTEAAQSRISALQAEVIRQDSQRRGPPLAGVSR